VRSFTIGIVGAGVISRNVHVPVLMSMPQARIAWIADGDEDRARVLAHANNLRQASLRRGADDLPECDVALLAIPVGARASYLDAFAKRGTGVFVEKPFARTAEEHLKFLEPFPPQRIGCGFMRRTYDSTLLLKKILEEGWFGRLLGIRAAEGARTASTRADRSYFDEPDAGGGGILLEVGCHAVDLALHITGATGHEIVRERMYFDGHADRKAEAEVALLTHGDRGERRIPLEFCFSWLDPQDNQMELSFETARVLVGNKPEDLVRVAGLRPESTEVRLAPLNRGARTVNQAFFLEWRHFLTGLDEGTPSVVAAASCLEATSLIEAVYRSARGA
jgi:predicted dehydrogenase